MSNDMDSDTCVGSKRRITDVEETLLQQPPSPPQLSASLSALSAQEESKDSSFIVSSSKHEQENPSPVSFTKVKCSFTEFESSIGEKLEVGFEESGEMLGSVIEENITLCDLISVSGSCGGEGTSEDFEKKLENFGVKVQERGNCVVCSVSDGEPNQDEIEEAANDLKEVEEKEKMKDFVKREVASYGIDNQEVSGECKTIEVEMSPVIDENKEILMVKEVEAEGLLEAKKKELLAKLELGSIFKSKTCLENVGGFDTNAGILGGLKGADDSVRRSLKIEVIDDTALIETVPVPKTGNGGINFAQGNGKKNEKQGTDGKKAKRSRKKGNVFSKVVDASEMQTKMTTVGEARNNVRKNGDQRKRKYLREEMEVMRFVNIVEQRKMWRDIYTGLGDAIVKEYNDLASSKHQKNVHLKFNPQDRLGWKKDAPGILGEISSKNVNSESENMAEDEVENADFLDPCCSHSAGSEDAYTVLEEECSEEDDSDEHYGSIQRPAFHVEGEPDFDSGPPEDGFEYLRRVRWEAAHIPKVRVAKLDRSKVNKEQSVYMPQIPDIAKCPEHLLPLKQWEDAFLADFSELRLFLSYGEGSSAKISHKLQSMTIVHKENTSFPQDTESIILEKFNNLRTDEVQYHKPLDDSRLENTTDKSSRANVEDGKILSEPRNSTSKTSVNDGSCNYPTLSAILAMDCVARVSILRERIRLAETMSTLSKSDCVWLFALCAAIDTPLDADTCAALRSLLRKCASLRAEKSELDDEVIMLNILATISGRYFGQSES